MRFPEFTQNILKIKEKATYCMKTGGFYRLYKAFDR